MDSKKFALCKQFHEWKTKTRLEDQLIWLLSMADYISVGSACFCSLEIQLTPCNLLDIVFEMTCPVYCSVRHCIWVDMPCTFQCNEYDGQCQCMPGRGGGTCGECEANHWGDPNVECHPCECDPDGSETMQCDRKTGNISGKSKWLKMHLTSLSMILWITQKLI